VHLRILRTVPDAAIDVDSAPIWRQQAGHDPEERRLPRSILSDDPYQPPAGGRERNVAEHMTPAERTRDV
jgi:hypothetical protein